MRQTWTTDDGITFDTEAEARRWEEHQKVKEIVVPILFFGPDRDELHRGEPTVEEIADFLIRKVPAAVEALLAYAERQQQRAS